MGVNKVIYDGETLVDLTGDTVTESSLVSGYTAHNAAGEQIIGTAEYAEVDHTHDDRYYTESEIDTKLDNKVDVVSGKGLSTNDYTTTEKNKLAGIAAGANAYTHPTYTAKSSGLYKVTVDGTGHVSATAAVAKSDITALGIPAQDTTYSAASQSAAGLMSAADKKKLDGIASGANNYTYTLPAATSSALGGVKSGTDITVDSSGNVSVNDDSHNHVISNIDGLQSALDGKAASSHTHDYVPTSRTVNGKALSANISLTASDVGAAASSHTHSYLPLAGGTITGNVLFDNSSSAQSGEPNIKWGTRSSNTPYIGFATDQTDGTFLLGSLRGTNYAAGLAIGGGSTNLLWKGNRVLDNADLTTVNSSISAKAPKDSPALTGTPTAPTAASGTNTTQIATTAFVQAAVSAASGDIDCGTF